MGRFSAGSNLISFLRDDHRADKLPPQKTPLPDRPPRSRAAPHASLTHEGLRRDRALQTRERRHRAPDQPLASTRRLAHRPRREDEAPGQVRLQAFPAHPQRVAAPTKQDHRAKQRLAALHQALQLLIGGTEVDALALELAENPPEAVDEDEFRDALRLQVPIGLHLALEQPRLVH